MVKYQIINKIQDKNSTLNKRSKKVLNIIGLTTKFFDIHCASEVFHIVNTATLAIINPKTAPLAPLNQDFLPEEGNTQVNTCIIKKVNTMEHM